MTTPAASDPWGLSPWKIDFRPPATPLPDRVDVAIVGAGFSGLATAACLRLLSPKTSVAVFEVSRIGSGASGRTGGMVLAETAAGDPPGLGDVLAGLVKILNELQIDCDLSLPGAWEIARGNPSAQSLGAPPLRSPIDWNDSGRLRVVGEIPGGTVDPGKLVSGLARAAHRLGARIHEEQPVSEIAWTPEPQIETPSGRVHAKKVLISTGAQSLALSGLAQRVQPRLTLAASTAPLTNAQLRDIGLAERKPFYTVDLPYLWGRLCSDNSIVLGAGLLSPEGSFNLRNIDIASGESSALFARLEGRVRGLHPALASVQFTHRWGGPISFRDNWSPVFSPHPQSPSGIMLGAYAGHGVALSVYFGSWAAEALLGRRALPDWGRLDAS